MTKKQLTPTVALMTFLFFFLPALSVTAANPPGPGDVLINEYVANSSLTEWVELYNTTGSDLDLSGQFIDDIDEGVGTA